MSGGLQSGSVGGAHCAARLVVAGRVQGVGFRWFTQRAADALRLSGWVRNRRDGTVEAEVIGERAAVEACIGKLREGPPGSAVDRLDVEWAEAPPAAPARTATDPSARGARATSGAAGSAGTSRRFEIRATL